MEVYETVVKDPVPKNWTVTKGKCHRTYTCKGVCIMLSNDEVFIEHEGHNVLSSFEFLPEDVSEITLNEYSANIITKGGIYVSLPLEKK